MYNVKDEERLLTTAFCVLWALVSAQTKLSATIDTIAYYVGI